MWENWHFGNVGKLALFFCKKTVKGGKINNSWKKLRKETEHNDNIRSE